MIDYTKLSQEQFELHCAGLYEEQERRAKISSIPLEVKKLSQDFQSLGGDKEDLIIKINEPKEQENEPITEPTDT